MQDKTLTLLQLNAEIKKIVRDNSAKYYWVAGEISEMKVNLNGHCYLELIQKDELSDQILARSRAVIWAQNYRLIKPYFETTTGQMLMVGISVLVKVNVDFHEVYGLSLHIQDIEPTYTVGEMAIRKQKIIERLIGEGVIDMNRELELPFLCQKIAVVSSPTSAGFEDFFNQLTRNPYGYKFYIKLFPAVMQGEETERSVTDALDRIFEYESFFDVAVIIRGGGSQMDLNCFNSYPLAYHITQFPLPVLTGIGHEQDDSVVDRVAHTRLKTPTAVAAYLIDMMAVLENRLDEWTEQMADLVRDTLSEKLLDLNQTAHRFHQIIKDRIHRHANRLQHTNFQIHKGSLEQVGATFRGLDRLGSRLMNRSLFHSRENLQVLDSMKTSLRQLAINRKERSKQKILFMEDKLAAFDPARVLERGYSITLKGGKPVKNSNELQLNDVITTLFNQGAAESIIKRKKDER